jgi:hypothetical protein
VTVAVKITPCPQTDAPPVDDVTIVVVGVPLTFTVVVLELTA